MRLCISQFSLLCAVISLSACATAPPNEHYLDAGARQHIKTVDAVLIAKQDEIGADIKRNATLSQISAIASSVSILPILLDVGVTGARAVNANKMAKPMRDTLEGHDYPREFRQQVKQSLAGTTLGGVQDFMILRNEIPGTRGKIISESEADAVLLVDMKYAFTPSFETLYVTSMAMLFPNRPELMQFQEKPDKDDVIEYSDNIYRNQYAVGISTGLKEATTSEHAAKWAQMNQETLVEALEVAGLMLADTMANDIGIDDLESDLNLIPEGYALNTKYDNFNNKFASIRSLDSFGDMLQEQSAPDLEQKQGSEDKTESDIDAAIVDVRTGS